MTMSSSDSWSQQSLASMQDRPLILRRSCDACSASKVKCGKQHPICGRCIANQIPCIYGVSHKYSSSKTARKRHEPDAGDGTASFRILAAHSNMQSFGDDLQLEIGDEWLAPANPASENKSGDFLESDGAASFDFMSDVPDVYYLNTERFASNPSQNNNAISTHSVESTTTELHERHCCYTQAYSVLRTLHPRHHPSNCSIKHLSPYIQPYSTPHINHHPDSSSLILDSVLASNKAAVFAIHELLSCTCAQDPHLAMLYSSMTCMIIGRYQEVVSTVTQTPGSPNTSFNLENGTNRSTTSTTLCSLSTLRRLPIIVGDFTVDEESQEVICYQILLSELRKVDQLIDRLATKQNNIKDQVVGGSAKIYESLSTWLKGELSRTTKDLRERVRESMSGSP